MKRAFAALMLAGWAWAPGPCEGALWTAAGGGAFAVEERLAEGTQRKMAVLLLHPAMRSDGWDISLDFRLRFDTEKGGFIEEEWTRAGDWLRPVERIRRVGPDGSWTVGLERLLGRTVGEGQLARGLLGSAEVDYIVPGLVLEGRLDDLTVEVLVDRPVRPNVAASSVTWRPSPSFRLCLEAAEDPGAPVSFSGRFEDGRPRASDEDAVSGLSALAAFRFLDGRSIDLDAFASLGRLSGPATGTRGGVEAVIDFSPYYTNRLSLRLSMTDCQGGFIPAYFDGIYAVSRWGLEGTPWLAAHPLGEDGLDGRMEGIECAYSLGEYFRVMGSWENLEEHQIRRAQFGLELLEESGRGLRAMAWSRAEGGKVRLFDPDRNLFAQVSAIYDLFPHTLLRLSFLHSWKFVEGESALVPVSSLTLGGEYSLTF